MGNQGKIFVRLLIRKTSIVRFGAVVLALIFCFGQYLPALAESLSDLNRQKQILQQQAEQAKQQAAAKQAQAQDLQNQLNIVNNQITQTQTALAQTANQINQTNTNIADLETRITTEEKNLADEKTKMANVVSAWYMENKNGLLESLLSSNNISDAVDAETAYDSVRQQIKATQDRITAAKNELYRQKNEKENQLVALSSLKNDQEAEKQSLEANQQLKNRLLSDTAHTISDLKAKEAAAQARIGEIDAKIRALSATSRWGDQIVSSNDPSWYYKQTGNYTHLGDSPYTVSQYGCLITSMAMVATYYGHHVTPSDIASNSAIFDDDGYLLVTSPPGIGVNISPSQGVNWNTVDDEINSGHPVIVSIYLPSVGAVNRDGSSHFVVIKGKTGSRYLMHDPIGDGRGYNISQVRSMKIVRPY